MLGPAMDLSSVNGKCLSSTAIIALRGAEGPAVQYITRTETLIQVYNDKMIILIFPCMNGVTLFCGLHLLRFIVVEVDKVKVISKHAKLQVCIEFLFCPVGHVNPCPLCMTLSISLKATS